jgi:DNA-binding XRE family transcriptional regulator
MPTRKFHELLDSMPANRRQKVATRVREEIAAMPLDELRKAREMTQVKLAQTLGVNQGEVSKIEHRADLYLSTLAEYVEALGGRLEIRAVFSDREVRIVQFEEFSK